MKTITSWLDQHPVIAYIIALLSGAVVPLAFAPVAQHWLIWPMMILFLMLQHTTTKQACLRAFGFGLGMFGVGVSWIYNSLHVYAEAPVWLGVLMTGITVVCLSAYLMLAAFCVGRWAPVSKTAEWQRYLLVWPAVWVSIELFRSWFLTGFPTLLLGYSQVNSWLGEYLPLLGVYGTGFMVMVVAGALSLVLAARTKQAIVIALGIVILVEVVALTSRQIDWTTPAGDPVSFAVVQGDIPQSLKFSADQVRNSLRKYKSLTEDHLNQQVIIWPETAITTGIDIAGVYLQGMRRLLMQHDQRTGQSTELLTGIFSESDDGRYYNSVYALSSQAVYRKQKLVPFGEYIPFRRLLSVFGGFLTIPMSDLKAGTADQSLLSMAGYPTATGICFESAFAYVYRQQLPAANWLLNVSNDAWFGDSFAPHQHLEMNQVRARELGRYLIRATNNGLTAVIDHRGQIVDQVPAFQTAVLITQAQPRQGATPYAITGNWPIIIIALLCLIISRRRTA